MGWVGLEPTTNALKGRCSTIELPTQSLHASVGKEKLQTDRRLVYQNEARLRNTGRRWDLIHGVARERRWAGPILR